MAAPGAAADIKAAVDTAETMVAAVVARAMMARKFPISTN